MIGDDQCGDNQSKITIELESATEKLASANTLFSFGTSHDEPTTFIQKNVETMSSKSVASDDANHPNEPGNLVFLVSSSNDHHQPLPNDPTFPFHIINRFSRSISAT